MSKTAKIVLGIVIAVIVVGGIWWWIASQSAGPSTAMVPAATSNSATSTSSASSTVSSTSSSSYPQGDSDQSIDQDMTSLNTQMNGMNSDNASVTQSMNDQPVQQAE
jgi:cytoskeletal protein RodZ